MKKLFISFITLALLMSQGAFAMEGDTEGETFSDLKRYDSYYTSVGWMYDEGIVEGYADGRFGIEVCVNRVEFLKMLFEIEGVDVADYVDGSAFPDTPDGEWYTDYVKAAKSLGVIDGYADGSFRPGNCMNRVEAMKMAVLQFNDGVVPEYRSDYLWAYGDVVEGEWYYDYADYALSANIVGTGHAEWESDGYKYVPAGGMTRGEVAEMLYRLRSLEDYNNERYQWGYSPAVSDEELFFNDCSLEGEGLSNINPEDLLPAGVDMAFTFDHTDDVDVDRFWEIIEKFDTAEQSFPDEIKAEYDSSVHKQIVYDVAVKPIVDADWEIAVGANLFSTEEYYVIANIENYESAEYLLGRFYQAGMDGISCEVGEDFVYWTSVTNDMYVAHSGELFVLANSEIALDSALSRLDGGRGGSFENVMEGDLFTLHFGNSFLTELADELSYSVYNDYRSIDLGLSVDGDGFVYEGLSELYSGSDLLEDYAGNDLSMIDKVAGNNIVAYVEEPSLVSLFDNDEALWLDAGLSSEFEEALSIVGLTSDELSGVVDAPVALVITNEELILPGMTLYLDFESRHAGLVEKAVNSMDDYVEDFIAEANAEAMADGVVTGNVLFVDGISGSGLRRVYVRDAFTDEFWAEGEELLGDLARTAVDLEFYYGITADDMFVMALYPNFEDDYGVVMASSDAGLKDARSILDAEGSSLVFVDFNDLMDVFEIYANVDEAGDMAEFIGNVRDYLSPIQYFIGSNRVSGDVMSEIGHIVIK